MTPLVPLALIGWLPISLLLFALLPARRAAMAVVIAGSLFLPEALYPISGLPEFGKRMAIAYGLLLGILALDSRRLTGLRLTLWDVPIICWCIVPALAAWSNGLGTYDAASGVFQRVMLWGVPWMAGRMYLSTAAGMRDLMWAIFLGGLVYVPLCLYELRMSPVLHQTLYGFHQHQFLQTIREGGYRPMVFLRHGLELTLWMGMAALMGAGLWKTTPRGHRLRTPIGLGVIVLAVTTASCNSVGAVVLMSLGLAILLTVGSSVGRLAWAGVLVMLAGYVGFRAVGLWDARALPDLVATVASKVRADSLSFRIEAENLLVEKSLGRPVLGWGGWSFNKVSDAERGTYGLVVDSMWIIALMKNGLFGLAAFFLAFWAASAGALARLSGFGQSRIPPEAVALGLCTTLFVADSTVNSFPSLAYILAAGGVTGALSSRTALSRARVDEGIQAADLRPVAGRADMLLKPRTGGLPHGLRSRSSRPAGAPGRIRLQSRS